MDTQKCLKCCDILNKIPDARHALDVRCVEAASMLISLLLLGFSTKLNSQKACKHLHYLALSSNNSLSIWVHLGMLCTRKIKSLRKSIRSVFSPEKNSVQLKQNHMYTVD